MVVRGMVVVECLPATLELTALQQWDRPCCLELQSLKKAAASLDPGMPWQRLLRKPWVHPGGGETWLPSTQLRTGHLGRGLPLICLPQEP